MTKIDLNNLDIRICNSNDVKDIYNIQEIIGNFCKKFYSPLQFTVKDKI